MHLLRKLRGGTALVCATALASAPLLVSTGAQATSAPSSDAAALPRVTATVTKTAVRLKGHQGLRAGRIHLTVKGKGIAEFARFKRGYDMADFTKDVNAFGAKGNMKALKRALANTEIFGGLAPGGTGTVTLPRAGTYTVFSLGERGVVAGPTFRVGAPRKSKAPEVDGRIIAKPGLAWGGSSHLPAKGTFLFKNKRNAGQPHFVALQQVEEGTTVDQVLEFLQSSEEGPPPPWLGAASFETGTLSPGRSMTADYDLPPGQYAVLCFFPDPKMKGMPHAMMGMIEMIHLM